MRFQSVLAACGLAVLVCPGAVAQSTTPAAPSTQQTAPNTPAGGLAPGAPPLQLQSLAPEEHTMTPAERAQVKRERDYRMAIRIATMQARWGAAMSTPGVSISLVETERTKSASGTTQFAYEINGTGFRAGEKLNLVRWSLGGSVKVEMGGLVLNPHGVAVCGDTAAAAKAAPGPAASAEANAPAGGLSTAPAPQMGSSPPPPPAGPPSCAETLKPNQPVEIETTAAPGEAIRVALVGEDRSNGAATQAVPFPIVDTDKSCSLQVLLGMKDGDMVVVEGTGFPRNAEVKLETTTGGKTHEIDSKTNPDGQMALAVLPWLGGETGGTTTVRYVGRVTTPGAAATTATADSSCAPAVSFHWGPGTYKPE